MNGVQCSCRCIGPVARRSRGEQQGRRVAWPTRSGDNGKNRFLQVLTGSFFVIDYLAPWSFQLLPFSSHPAAATPLPWVFVIVPRFVSPSRPSTLRPAARLRPVASSVSLLSFSFLLFSLLRTLVSQTLAKPRRRQRLSCRSTRLSLTAASPFPPRWF